MMDTYENNPQEQTPNPVPQQPQEQPARRVSPYEDSPYVMNHQQPPAQQSAPQTYTYPQQPQAVQPKKKKSGAWKVILAIALAVVLVGGTCGATALTVSLLWNYRMETVTEQFRQEMDALEDKLEAASGDENIVQVEPEIVPSLPQSTVPEGTVLTPAQVYAQNVDSVVLIYSSSRSGYSTGSGFIITEDGYVVTNYHVVEGGTSVQVTTHSGDEYDAEVIGYDDANDVALLKMKDASGLQAAALGSSSDLIVGDQVAAIGNPLGELTSTLTVGYISAMERDVTTDSFAINMIQTDAAINSGNSGGPLFNMRGEVIGITSAKYSGTSSSGATIEGIGFAIPIDDVLGMLEDLMEYGYVTGAYLGVSVSDMNAEAASAYGLPMGAYVQEVVSGSCAQTAGLQVKDIITALGEYEVETVNDLTRALRNFEAGDTTTLTVYRSGAELTLNITLDEKPQETEQEQTQQMPSDSYDGMPPEGDFEEWFEYLYPYFGN